MKLFFIVAILLFGLFNSNAQLATWPLVADGNPTNVAQNVIAGVFKKGTGLNTLSFGSSGASCSGWTTNTNPDTADYYQITIAPNTGYRITINTIAFGERRSSTGIRMYQVRISNTPNFSSFTTLATVNVPDDDLERDGTITGLNIIINQGETLYIRWYGYQAESSAGTWRINDNTLSVSGTVTVANTNDNDSYAGNPVQQIQADTISSLRTTAGLAKAIFTFNLYDNGTSDGLPTKVSVISVKNSLSSNWQNIIAGAFLKLNNNLIPALTTTVNQNSITFQLDNGALTIPNNSSVSLDFYIYLKDSGLIDQTAIQCYVDGTSFDAYVSGSGFSTNFPSVVSNIFTIEAVASKIRITQQPSIIFPQVPFSLMAEVIDANGNRDITFQGNLYVHVELGSGQISSNAGLIKPVVNGVVSWNDLIYNVDGIIQLSVKDEANILQTSLSQYIYSIIPPSTLYDDFTDGNFNQNPTWTGSTGDFIINTNNQLELNTVASGSVNYAYLTTPVKINNDSTEWQAWINLKISPSSNNNVRYYLLSNNSDLTKPLKGYYILIGEDGSNDAIKFFYQDSTTSTLLATGQLGYVANNPQVRIKVIRDIQANWRIYADYVGGSAFVLENTINHNAFIDSIVFTGVICKFSTSYAKSKFFFDEFYTGPVQIDTIKPTLVDVLVVDSLHIDLLFSEGISLQTAQNTSNYVVNNNIGTPVTAVRDNLNAALIHLTFSTPFTSGQEYTIAFFNLTDLANNPIPQPLAANFMWYYPAMFDVVINEIMADPTPKVQLPEFEYVELYNRSAYDLELKNWIFKINNTTIPLPSFKLQSGKYVLLAHASAVSSLQQYGAVLPVFSSTSVLTNSGAFLQLKYKDGKIIHFVEYSDKWYKNTSKDDGGWSLEQIDPNNPCGSETNWTASKDAKGGTPGAINSVNSSNSDTYKPDVLRAVLWNNDSLIVTFNETVLTSSLQPQNYIVSHGIGNPTSVSFIDLSQKKVLLTFSGVQFLPDTIYTLTILQGISDCVGNITQQNITVQFGIGSPILPGDIVINEVLFYEPTGGTDYVELYNKTSKIFNLKDLKLVTLDSLQQISVIKPLTNEGFYLFPNDYVVITKSLSKVMQFYTTPYPKKVLEMSDFPALKSTGDRLTFVNNSLQVIDDFQFSESMHFQLLNSFKGVALERIHPSLPTQEPKSWHSASQNVGFGTPTYQNSQFSMFQNFDGEITVEPEIFSPDLDGKDDILYIRYKFPEAGYVANAQIFDSKGRLIRKLVRNELCGIEGYFTWDGLSDAKTKAEIGMYIVYIEVFHLNGTTKSFKKPCVVGGYLR
ncbi:MAG: lamin tail domain-containing protein [Bacteroidales bacterium]|nr:lamin tail domain-containing protein [Bacteroidales bacterium]